MSVYQEPEVLAAKSQIINEARSAASAAQQASDAGFVTFQMAEFGYKHDVSDCSANRKILDEELKKFAEETLGQGQFYRFTSKNLEALVQKKPQVLEMLARTPVTTSKENPAEAEKKFREQLINALIQAGVSQQYLEFNKEIGARWVDLHSIAELQQLLANVENERKWRLMDRNTLKQQVRGQQAHLGPEPLPVVFDLVRRDIFGHETRTTYPLDTPEGLEKLLRAMSAKEQRKFQAQFGLKAINDRLGGII